MRRLTGSFLMLFGVSCSGLFAGGCAGNGSGGSGTAGGSATGVAGAASDGATGGTTGTGGAIAAGGHGGGGRGGSGGMGDATATGGAGPGATGGAGGAVTGEACPSNAIFCATFEDDEIPSAATYYPAYQQPMASMYMAVDASVGANGSGHSLKVTPGSNFSQMLGVPTGTPTFWTRMYIRTDYPTSMVSGHDTFINATDGNGDPNDGAQIRVGEHSCQLEVNQQPGDAEVLSDATNGSSNYTCAGGIAFSTNTWYCLEVFYDGPQSTIRVFVDGTESTALGVTNWGPYMYDMFKFGFENYGASFGSNQRTIWYDDVVIAPQQIHCL